MECIEYQNRHNISIKVEILRKNEKYFGSTFVMKGSNRKICFPALDTRRFAVRAVLHSLINFVFKVMGSRGGCCLDCLADHFDPRRHRSRELGKDLSRRACRGAH